MCGHPSIIELVNPLPLKQGIKIFSRYLVKLSVQHVACSFSYRRSSREPKPVLQKFLEADLVRPPLGDLRKLPRIKFVPGRIWRWRISRMA